MKKSHLMQWATVALVGLAMWLLGGRNLHIHNFPLFIGALLGLSLVLTAVVVRTARRDGGPDGPETGDDEADER